MYVPFCLRADVNICEALPLLTSDCRSWHFDMDSAVSRLCCASVAAFATSTAFAVFCVSLQFRIFMVIVDMGRK